MKYSYVVFLALLFSACSTIDKLKTTVPAIPCIGSVGKVSGGIFSKAFQKVGEPEILSPISVTLKSEAFSQMTFNSYKKYREAQGKFTSLNYTDSVEIKPRYFTMEVSDYVSLKSFLNGEKNRELRNYLEQDKNIEILTQVAFVAPQLEQILFDAKHVSIIQENGRLAVQLESDFGRQRVAMNSLEVFDFKTATFCWNENKRGRPEIALINTRSQSCPKGTEKSADKLDRTKQYLKL
jgi:hypothetical protein